MRKFLVLLLMVYFTVANAQFLPPTRIQGEDSSLATIFNFIMPKNQATKVSSVGYRLETGNENILANPSFEHSTVATGWTNANGTTAANTSTYQDGLQSLAVTLTAQSLDLTQEFVAGSSNYDEAYNGRNPSFSCYVNASEDVDLCFTFGGSNVVCDTYDSTNNPDTWQKLEARGSVLQGNNFGISLESSSITDVVYIDNCKFDPNSLSTADIPTQYHITGDERAGWGSTDTFVPYFTNFNDETNPCADVTNDSTNGFRITMTKRCKVTAIIAHSNNVGNETIGWLVNPTTPVNSTLSSYSAPVLRAGSFVGSSSHEGNAVISEYFDSGDIITPVSLNLRGGNLDQWYVSVVLEDTAETTIIPSKSNTNTFGAVIANNGTASITSQGGRNYKGEHAIASVNRSSVGVVDITFTTNFFSQAPAITAVVNESAAGSTRDIHVAAVTASSATIFTFQDLASSPLDEDFDITITRQGTDFKEQSYLTAVAPTQTCYVEDVKADGTDGGGCTSGSWHTRDLNTTSGTCWFVDLSSNQITLSPGKYSIAGSAPSHQTNSHQTKVVEDPGGSPSDIIIGTTEESSSSGGTQTRSFFYGDVDINSSTTYEVQHRCSVTNGTNGFGDKATFGVGEVYTRVRVTRIIP